MTRAIAMTFVLTLAGSAQAGIMRITEYMYQGADLEFVEFCNIGSTPTNMAGWSYDDDSRTPGSVDLSAFGIVQPGECVIIAESTAGQFNNRWALGGTVKIIGSYTHNLGRNDEINLYDKNGNLVDRLTYGDQTFPSSIRTQNRSGWVSPAGIGQNNIYAWTLSSVGDAQGSWTSTGGDIGSPGRHTPIPEPATLGLMALVGIAGLRRRR